MKRFLALVLTAVMALSLIGCGGGSSSSGSTGASSAASGPSYDKLKLKMSYATGDTGMDGVTAIKFEELVEERSGGAIQVDRYPNCQLSGGDMQRHVEMMTSGAAFELAIISTSSFNVVDDAFYIAGTPFMYKTYDDMWAIMDGEGGQFMNELYAKYNIQRLDTMPNGLMHIANSKHPVTCVADMANLKMRTYGDTQMKLMRALGADPVNMSFSELYSALQTGTVDGNTNGYQTMFSASFQEVQHYITECGIIGSTYDILANKPAFDKWSPDTQKLIQECATEAAHYARQYMVDTEADCKQAFIDAGAEIVTLTDEQIQEFRDAAAPVIDECKALAGEEACKAFGL